MDAVSIFKESTTSLILFLCKRITNDDLISSVILSRLFEGYFLSLYSELMR
jgi:hypothetical protein